MIPLFMRLLIVVAFFAASATRARDVASLFPREADVFAERSGLASLALPPEVLAACRADLGDLRLFDRNGREIPYVVDTRRKSSMVVESAQHFTAKVLDVERSESRSDSGPPIFVETYTITAPTEPPEAGSWQLVLSAGKRSFVRRVVVRALDGEDEAVLAETSLYNLAANVKTAIDLPPFRAERLAITLAGADGSYVEPSFRFVATRALADPPEIVVPLEEVSRRRGDGAARTTEILLRRPRGLIPERLRFATGTQTFSRAVSVEDVRRRDRDCALTHGNARVFRVGTARDLAQLDVGIEAARGDLLRVTIDDGDSPPLAELVIAAILPQPTLLFSLESAVPEGPTATLRFGGGRAEAPRYDVAAFLPQRETTLRGLPAEAAVELLEAASLVPARLGDIRSNPAFDASPALAFAMHAGAAIDPRVFTHRRRLQIVPSADGLAQVDLTPADLAVARSDFADVRIVDDARRQWPYLLEHDVSAQWVNLGFDRRSERRTSRYELKLDHSPALIAQLNLDVRGDRQFDRAYRVVAKQPDGVERVVSAGRIVSHPDDIRRLTLALDSVRATAMEIVVEDGDDAPLDIVAIRARFPVPALFAAAPQGSYWLMLGHADAQKPRYEIARVRDIVLAVDASPVSGGTVEANPEYSLRARLAEGGTEAGTVQRALVWGAIVLAVAVLGVVTLRLARQ